MTVSGILLVKCKEDAFLSFFKCEEDVSFLFGSNLIVSFLLLYFSG